MKYGGADGALLWEKRGGRNIAGRLVLGPHGMIVMAGSSRDSDWNYDYATFVYHEDFSSPSLMTPARSGNDFQFAFDGATAMNYSVLVSTNLVDWSVIGTATMVAPGQFRFIDPSASQSSARFYRVKVP